MDTTFASQTFKTSVRIRELTFWENVHHQPRATCHMSHIACLMQRSTKFVLVGFKSRTNYNLMFKSWWKLRINKIKSGQEWLRRVSVTETDRLWYTKTVCDRQRLSITDKICLWQTYTVCDGQRQSVINTDCLWQAQTVCDRHRLSVTDTDCLWQPASGQT